MAESKMFKCRVCGLGVETAVKGSLATLICPLCLGAHQWCWLWHSKMAAKNHGTSIATSPSGAEIEFTQAYDVSLEDTERHKTIDQHPDLREVGVGYWKRAGAKCAYMMHEELPANNDPFYRTIYKERIKRGR